MEMATVETPVSAPAEREASIYNRVFWLAYVANLTLVTANALTFRFAELVAYLGGSESIAGTIVGVGVAGALVARLFLGRGIDHYGTRTLWFGSCLLFIVSCALFLVCHDISLLIFVTRIGFAVSVAGMFTCSIVHIQNLVPAARRTEVIGNLGSSGFLGMILGSQLGDWIFAVFPEGRPQFLALFGGTVILGVVYLALVVAATRGDGHVRPHCTLPAHKLLFRYWPGNVVLVAMMMGVSITVTTVFLTRFATHAGFKNAVGTFFTGYAILAFTFRIATQRWSNTIGRHRMILLGLLGHAVCHASLPFVRTEWQFIFPAVAGGFGHALLFPAVVSKGAGQFPRRFRGSGTTLVLGFVDLGTALFAPALGGIIDYFDHTGFREMFFTSAGVSLSVAVIYALTTARKPDVDRHGDDDSVLHVPGRLDETTPDDESDDDQESVAVPFPHLGRNP
jgi:MFS family permease